MCTLCISLYNILAVLLTCVLNGMIAADDIAIHSLCHTSAQTLFAELCLHSANCLKQLQVIFSILHQTFKYYLESHLLSS